MLVKLLGILLGSCRFACSLFYWMEIICGFESEIRFNVLYNILEEIQASATLNFPNLSFVFSQIMIF